MLNRGKKISLSLIGIVLPGFLFMSHPLLALEEGEGRQHEMGFWIGATTPLPGSEVSNVVDSSVGGGLFYRIDFPFIFYTELGGSYSIYSSRTSQKLAMAPVYGALVYKIPYSFKINTYIKLGGGSSYLEIRPDNRSGWEPAYYGGLEFSLLAGKSLRVGMRFDYFYIKESQINTVVNDNALYYMASQYDPGQSFDPRWLDSYNYKMVDGRFVHIGLMISFIL